MVPTVSSFLTIGLGHSLCSKILCCFYKVTPFFPSSGQVLKFFATVTNYPNKVLYRLNHGSPISPALIMQTRRFTNTLAKKFCVLRRGDLCMCMVFILLYMKIHGQNHGDRF